MNEVINGVDKKESEILHYYNFRSTSVKLIHEDDRYVVVLKKYILHMFKKVKRYEFSNLYEAEDMYLEQKSFLQYQGRAY
ncbi:MAG: hypothetical protein HF314_11605 [Ignavibacteria bacterium]|jgi:hypothetical protein|nr:hypothetical protein [Ignavibacteria bacterium]MCU7503715.1 hypothetical protein [Ignavibacteria bacterium]MCU7517639.1 hypothetical protein [Ignavibacteria bacterium]